MTLLLLVLLSAFDNDAAAGAACRAAAESVRQGRYDEAVASLQEALRNQPRETEKLKYRDNDGLHAEPYYPHFQWAMARTHQARGEKETARRRQLLREAITHLELTHHPLGAETLKQVQQEIATIEKTLAASDESVAALTAIRQKVDALCDQENFEEAGRAAAREKELLDRFPAERAQLLELVEGRRNAVLTRYEKTLDLALETVAAAPPIDKPETLSQLLLPALPPPTVCPLKEGRFLWLREFVATLQERLGDLRTLKTAEGPKIVSCARTFEQSASRALASGTFSGFRAAMSLAHAVRWSRIQALSGGRDDVQLDRLLTDSEEAAQQLDKGLGRTREVDAWRTGVLAPHAARLRDEREKLRHRAGLAADVDRWIARADLALSQKTQMASPEALRSVARDLAPLEQAAAWKESPAPLRAKALYARAVLEAVSAFLEGEAAPGTLDRAAAGIKAARALDPKIDEPWKERLSPKLKTWLDRLDR